MLAQQFDSDRFWPKGREVPTSDELRHTLDALEAKTGYKCQEKKFAESLDQMDDLKDFREKFNIPTLGSLCGVAPEYVQKMGAQTDALYLCSNSLGLQPKEAQSLVQSNLDKWARVGVQGHFAGEENWVNQGDKLQADMSDIVGASPDEVVIMNTLSVNLHVLLASFYRPTEKRCKILIEARAFPSDHYVALSQVTFHGYDESALIVVDGGSEAVMEVLEERGEEIALVLLPGVQYYSGLLLDMPAITAAAHHHGCLIGWDLAHATGNVELLLHDWDVDFAAWCTYKYMCAGPGCVGVAFVHAKHFHSTGLPRLLGWWGHDTCTRFDMTNEFQGQAGARAYAMSSPGALNCACLKASLNLFAATSMAQLRAKSTLLTGYMEKLIREGLDESAVHIMTPSQPGQRGAQLSLFFPEAVEKVYRRLSEHGVVVDLRKPDVLRVAPTPMLNSFVDVWRFVEELRAALL